jgi:hypothetical protein
MPREIAFHEAMLPASSFDSAETSISPAIVIRNRSKATPGNPTGNIEKSLCIREKDRGRVSSKTDSFECRYSSPFESLRSKASRYDHRAAIPASNV